MASRIKYPFLGSLSVGGGYRFPGSSAAPAVLADAVFQDVASADISYVGIGSTTYASRTNTTVTPPGGIVDDDFLLLSILTAAATTAPTATPPAGFTEIGTVISVSDGGGFNVRLRTFYKRASSESGSYTLTHTACTSQAHLTVFRNVDWSSGPFDATQTQNNGTGTTRTWTGLTTANASSMIVATGFDWGDTSNNLSPPAGMTEALDTSISYLAYETIAAAGSTGNRSHTNNVYSSNPWGARLIALRKLVAASSTSISASQTLEGVSQSASIAAIASLSASQTLPGVSQTATVAAVAAISSSVTLEVVSQTASISTAAGAASISASQTLEGVSQSASIGAVAGVTASQALQGVSQSASLASVSSVSANQTLALVSQTATVAVSTSISAVQALEGVSQAATLGSVASIGASQTLDGATQSASLNTSGVTSISANQTLEDVSQTATIAVVPVSSGESSSAGGFFPHKSRDTRLRELEEYLNKKQRKRARKERRKRKRVESPGGPEWLTGPAPESQTPTSVDYDAVDAQDIEDILDVLDYLRAA